MIRANSGFREKKASSFDSKLYGMWRRLTEDARKERPVGEQEGPPLVAGQRVDVLLLGRS